MAAIGLSQSGKDARGAISEIPRWLKARMERSFGQSDRYGAEGDAQTNAYLQYLQQILAKDPTAAFGSIADITGYGREAMPGVDEANTDRLSRLGRVEQTLRNIPSRTDVTASLRDNTENLNKASFNLTDFIRSQIGQTFGDLQGLSDTAYSDVGKNIFDTYSREVGNVYNDYGNIRNTARSGFDEATKELSKLGPGGDLSAAAASRSFAPMMAAAFRRLRASGVDPNSSEASGILQAVDTARGRSMDDILSKTMADQVAQKNALTLGRTNTDATLQQRMTDLARQLQLEQSGLNRENTLAQLGTNSDIVARRGNANVQNEQDFYGRHRDIADRRNTVATTDRNMGVQDVGLESGLADDYNNAALQNLKLILERFNTGVEGVGRNNVRADAAAQGVGQIGQQNQNRSLTYDQLAAQYAQQAAGQFGNAFQTEQASSNWLGRLLGGVAQGGLNALTGGFAGLAQKGLSKIFGGGQDSGSTINDWWTNYNPSTGYSTPPITATPSGTPNFFNVPWR